MRKSFGREASGMKIRYQCDYKEKDCTCDSVIEFEKEPKSISHCCGASMKRMK